MTEQSIQQELHHYFQNYDYHLRNTYVFGWESDFLCASKSKYWTECEIKISRSDFFKDFEKGKHKIFQDLQAGKEFSVAKWGYFGESKGDVLIKDFQVPQVHIKGYRPGWGDKKDMINGDTPLIEENPEYRRNRFKDECIDKRFIVNDWQDRLMIRNDRWDRKDIHAPVSRIWFLDLLKGHYPHRFYYCTPKGLLKPGELPAYAGLIEISHCPKMVKQAPFLHKRPMDLTKALLQKFYNLWKYKGDYFGANKDVEPKTILPNED